MWCHNNLFLIWLLWSLLRPYVGGPTAPRSLPRLWGLANDSAEGLRENKRHGPCSGTSRILNFCRLRSVHKPQRCCVWNAITATKVLSGTRAVFGIPWLEPTFARLDGSPGSAGPGRSWQQKWPRMSSATGSETRKIITGLTRKD